MSEGCQLYEVSRKVTGTSGEVEQTGPTRRGSHNWLVVQPVGAMWKYGANASCC